MRYQTTPWPDLVKFPEARKAKTAHVDLINLFKATCLCVEWTLTKMLEDKLNIFATYTKLREQPGIMTAFNFEKAFDSFSWKFLISTLQSFNCGNSFINWVKTLYSNISSCALNNGFSTQLFDVQRGVRQGDPLSPYLFIIALEVLLIKI